MSKKQWIKAILFIAIFTIIYLYLNDIFISKWTTDCKETYVSEQFYDLEKDTIEVLVLGGSQVALGISPLEMYEEYGISAYNVGFSSEPVLVSYYWLREVLKTQDIKVVVFETSMLYETSAEANYRKGFDTMKMSIDKLQGIKRHVESDIMADSISSYLLKFMKYHSRWDELTEEDFVKSNGKYEVFNGYVPKFTSTGVDYSNIVLKKDEEKEMVEMVDYQIMWFEEILKYCNEQEIEVVLAKTPKDDWTMEKSEQVHAYAKEKGLKYFDFNEEELLKEISFNIVDDMYEGEHLNLRGAKKVSSYLGKYLNEEYSLKDFRDEKLYDEEYLNAYKEKYDITKLREKNTLKEYMEYLRNDNYDTIISLTDGLEKGYVEEYEKLFEKYGIELEPDKNFVGHILEGEIKNQKVSEEVIKYSNRFSNGIAFNIVSDIEEDSGEHIIKIGDTTYKFEGRGLNILIYDYEDKRIIDNVTFRYDSESEDFVRYFGKN